MNNITYAFLLSSIAGLSTLIGSLFVFIKINNNNNNNFISFCLSFAMTIMIGVSILDLLPEAFFSLFKRFNYLALVFLLLSFIMAYLLIKYLNKCMDKYNDSLYKLGVMSLVVLMLHNFPEGILTFLSSAQNKSFGIKLTIAIALHNIPEGISIALPIYFATNKKLKPILLTLFSSLSEILGAVLAYLFLYKYLNIYMIDIILFIVAGLMITLSIEKIYPEINDYHNKKTFLLGIFIGIIILLISLFI